MPLSPSILSVLSEDLLVRVYGFLDPPCRKKMATRQQRVSPSRLTEPHIDPNPPSRVPPRASLQLPEPLLPRPLRLPQTRRRRRSAPSVPRRRFDKVAEPEPRHRAPSQGTGDAGSLVPRPRASRRVSLLGVRR